MYMYFFKNVLNKGKKRETKRGGFDELLKNKYCGITKCKSQHRNLWLDWFKFKISAHKDDEAQRMALKIVEYNEILCN